MHRGLPTLLAFALLAAATSLSVWWAGQQLGTAQGAAQDAVLTSRPVPQAGWGPMRVITANIRLDMPVDGENGWVNRRELLTKTLLKYQPEILGCQEVSPVQGAYLTKELAAWYAYYPRAGVGSDQQGATRSAGAQLLGALSGSLASLNTLYYRADRFDILDGEAGLVLPGEPQADAAENTFFTLAVLREKTSQTDETKHLPATHTLIVVDIHFRHGEAFAIQCATKLRQKLATWEEKFPGSGILVMGDINRDKTTKLYATLTTGDAAVASRIAATAGAKMGADGNVLMLQDAFDYSKWIGGGGKTWGTYHGFAGTSTQPWPTDLIFVGGGLKVTHAAEIMEDHGPPPPAKGRYPSDHFFVSAELGW
ncbi:MAG TPA: endonuclease/exonuclease/phosphatase family protein [Phycisphaerae bacterium]